MLSTSHHDQHERVLRALRRQVGFLRHDIEKRQLVIGRLESFSRLSRSCARMRTNTRLRHLSKILERGLPGQISLLQSELNCDNMVADAIDRMILENSLLPDAAFVDDQAYEADAEENEQSEMDLSDDSYIARVLLNPAWDDSLPDVEIIIDF